MSRMYEWVIAGAAYYCTYVERDIEIYSNLHSCDMNTSTHIVTEISRTSQKWYEKVLYSSTVLDRHEFLKLYLKLNLVWERMA